VIYKPLRIRYEPSALFYYVHMYCWYCGRRMGSIWEVSACTWAWRVWVPGEETLGFAHTALGAKRMAVRELKRQLADRRKALASKATGGPQHVRRCRQPGNREAATGNH
jgi:hypothetical protein